MKRILLFLALILGVKVSGQIVGGFVPINSAKSVTVGNLRVNGALTVTGSITGTASNVTFSNVIAAGTLSVVGQSSLTNKVRIGSAVAPSATLDVTGTMSVSSTATVAGALTAQSTMSLGSANLTGGSTGTVAVLSDAVFGVFLNEGANSTQADLTNYVIGQGGAPPSTTLLNGNVYFPYNATLVGWSYSGTVKTTPSSAESYTLSAIIGTSTVVLSSAITNSLASGYNNYSGSGLSTQYTANTLIYALLSTPSLGTNPTNVYTGVTLWFVRRP